MTSHTINAKANLPMSEIEAIYQRRAVRNYQPQQLDKPTIHLLLDAAVQAPTAMHEEPWSFVIIQNQDRLNRLSDSAKTLVRRDLQGSDNQQAVHMLEFVNKPDFHVFYNASSLIIIYSKFDGPFVVADCWLAAENLMLTACAKGLGTCVIGFAVTALNSQEWQDELGIPAGMQAIAPIIVGIPADELPPAPVSRKKPEVFAWK